MGGVLDCPPQACRVRHPECPRRGDRRTMTHFRHKGLFVLQKPRIKTAVSTHQHKIQNVCQAVSPHEETRNTLKRCTHLPGHGDQRFSLFLLIYVCTVIDTHQFSQHNQIKEAQTSHPVWKTNTANTKEK